MLTFNQGRDSISQDISLLQDNIVEHDEDFSCNLSLMNAEDEANVLIFHTSATVTIHDRDGMSTI